MHPFSNGFELNVRLDYRKRITPSVLRNALTILNRHLHRRHASVRVEAGLLLRNTENGSLRYWYPGADSSLLPSPFINNGPGCSTLRDLFLRLCEVNLDRTISFRYYPNSKWVVIGFLGLRFIVSFRG